MVLAWISPALVLILAVFVGVVVLLGLVPVLIVFAIQATRKNEKTINRRD